MSTIITERELYSIPLSSITDIDTGNIRSVYDDATLKELAASIKSEGLLSPLIVREGEDDTFLLVAGHRRYRALQMLVKSGDVDADQVVTCFVNEGDIGTATVTMLVENLQREDIAIMDEARGYMRLVGEHGFKVKDLATAVGRSQAHVQSRLALLVLDPALQACIGTTVTIETATDIAKVTDDTARKALSKQAVKGTLGTWKVQTQLRDEAKAKDKAKITDWAAKNMITLHVNRHGSPAADHKVWKHEGFYPLADLKTYVPKKGDVVTETFANDGVVVYRKFTKAELAEQEQRKADVAANAPPVVGRGESPYTEWEARCDAHDELVEEFSDNRRAARRAFITDIPTKMLGKIILELAVSQVLASRSISMYSGTLVDLAGIEVVDMTPQQAIVEYVGTSTEKAMRLYVQAAATSGLDVGPTLTEGFDAELTRLGLVDPGEFTEPEPWQDNEGNWHLEEFIDESGMANVEDYDDEAEPTDEASAA